MDKDNQLESDVTQRLNWKKGSKVLIYSESKKAFVAGTIDDIKMDKNVEQLVIKYEDDEIKVVDRWAKDIKIYLNTSDINTEQKENNEPQSALNTRYDPEIMKILRGWGMEETEIQEAMDAVQDPNNITQLARYMAEKAQTSTYEDYKDHGLEKFSEKAQTSKYEEYKDHGIEKNNTDNIDKTVVKFPVQVFVRFRPMIKEEIAAEHKALEFKKKSVKKSQSTTLSINDITKKVRQSAIKKKKKGKAAKPPIKSFKGFRNILTQKHDNESTFKACILPSIDNIFSGYTVCAFAYGHTGSGKTHTILGYDDDERAAPGMYRQTVEYISNKLQLLGASDEAKSNETTLLSCRFAELYQGKMRDLFGDLVECHVREDDDGNINIRGPTIKDEETGKVSVQPLTPVYIKQDEADTLIMRVKKALTYRNTGSSTLHEESSRSHCFLEMELVTNTLIETRDKLLIAEANIVPVGKARDEMKIVMGMKMMICDENGKYSMDPNWKLDKEDNDKLAALQAETDRLQAIIDTLKEECRKEINDNKDKGIGGTVVFVDLAGNEYGQDSKQSKTDNKIQASERKEINKSLLSLKECIRALHSHKSYVPYRDSKLTMVLRPYLKGKNSTAIMIANVSPSEVHVNKTYNTLRYSQLVAKA